MNINKYLIYILINQFPISLFLIWWKPGMVEVSSQGALFHCAQKSSLTLIFTRDTQYLCVLKLKRLPASYWLEKRNIHLVANIQGWPPPHHPLCTASLPSLVSLLHFQWSANTLNHFLIYIYIYFLNEWKFIYIIDL